MADIARFFRRLSLLAVLGSFPYTTSTAQPLVPNPLVNRTVELGELHVGTAFDKCGPISEKALEAKRELLGDGWGYGYDQLLTDLDRWKTSQYVSVQSIGRSVLDRDIWEVIITSDKPQTTHRRTVTIHARTHPHETQSWWVCEQIINFLLSDDPWADYLRQNCTFHIIPMYNPDGVEDMNTRENHNGVDLEREWDKPNAQPEAVALKRRYLELMNSEAPIEVALNLHSSSDPERYFWFHDQTGSSEEFANLERQFIAGVRTWFQRIMPWDYRVSWKDQTPSHFPESWFWLNYGTDVMALTYEDVFSHNLNTPDAHFDSAAWALLRGVAGYLGLQTSSVAHQQTLSGAEIIVRSITPGQITLSLPAPVYGRLSVYDALGREVAILAEKQMQAGTEHYRWDSEKLPSGFYFVRLETLNGSLVQQVRLVR